MKNVLLDTSVLIAEEKGTWRTVPFLENYVGIGQVGISAITASEFQEGIYRAPPGKRRENRERLFGYILDTFPVWPFDLALSTTHAQLKTGLSEVGIVVGPHDLIIAATALKLGWELATLNEVEFSRIPDLALADLSSGNI